ncbi:hypothetical protein ACFDWB_004960 [Salmonella enterica]|nr:hypothetical protein [Salmonella enterica]EHG3080188.1 hypothetical protein [Salmonella enterica]EHN6577560.1 hypothetical protein [Salmonella enterica subsp. enterica serovar Anecho]EMB9904355.1 hypothetical protein [Salmonella enterica]
MNKQKMHDFNALVQPLMKWLELNCDTNSSIYIDFDHAELNNTAIYVVSENNDFTEITPEDTDL